MREKGVDSPYLFLHPGFNIVANPAHPEENKMAWTYMSGICFFIAALVLLLGLLILKGKCL